MQFEIFIVHHHYYEIPLITNPLKLSHFLQFLKVIGPLLSPSTCTWSEAFPGVLLLLRQVKNTESIVIHPGGCSPSRWDYFALHKGLPPLTLLQQDGK